MKKIFLLLFVLTFYNVNAQKIGALAGFTSLIVDVDDASSESESGFHLGVFTHFDLSEKIGLQPEVTYSSVEDLSMISVNGIFKYHATDALNVQLGPQIGFAGGDGIDALETLLGDDFTKLNLQLAVGLGYSFSDNFMAQARYGFQLNDHYTGDLDGGIKINTLSIGIGYTF